jgi:hypothetical protein
MFRLIAAAAAAVILATPALARVLPFPASFRTQMVHTNGGTGVHLALSSVSSAFAPYTLSSASRMIAGCTAIARLFEASNQ